MLKLSIQSHRRNSAYEVKAWVSFAKIGGKENEYTQKLKDMQSKLEQVVPSSFHAKYNVTKDELIVSVPAEKARDAQRVTVKLEDFISTAAAALKLR